MFLPDTDTVNYVLKGKGPARRRLQAAAAAGEKFALSPVVHYEVTRYLKLKQADRVLRLYEALIADWHRVELTAVDWDRAAELWSARHRAGAPITDSDLLIAVSALGSGSILVTNNDRHFANLGLHIDNWAI
jgi:predicted nucleic acid-binding protein